MKETLGGLRGAVDAALAQMASAGVLRRIWDRDHTVWKSAPTEITNRLDWLTIASEMAPKVDGIARFVDEVRGAGFTNALLLGMGGSSLAPEVMKKAFGVADGFLDLAILDSTDPGYVLAHERSLDITKTLFIVATKSGGTTETLSAYKYFYNRLADAGVRSCGKNFIAITDPGSSLEALARDRGFRATFLNNPNIGGRYSALSYFGMVPAALIGADVGRLLRSGAAAAAACGRDVAPAANPAARLGAIVAVAAKAGRDKLTFVSSARIAGFEDWVEQLVAESTGKEGRGVLPVVAEPLGPPAAYGDDRLFVHLALAGDRSGDSGLEALAKAGHPVVEIALADEYDLGAQYLVWELATAVAGHLLCINPFDQPDVESAKVQARSMIDAYRRTGSLPTEKPSIETPSARVYGQVSGGSAGEAVARFVDAAPKRGYVSLHAYLTPSEEAMSALRKLRRAIAVRTRRAVTIGFGPRFLHSTGQLHKGDAGNGVFIQFTADAAKDLAIPDEAGSAASSMTFGVLEQSQALGDRKALEGAKRRVVRVHFATDPVAGINAIAEAV